MPDTTYGTGATGFTDGSTRLISTIKKKSHRVRKKHRKRKSK